MTQNDQTKPRQIWIEFGGDPSNDKEVYKRYSATTPFEPLSPSEEVIHCIEMKAFNALQAENAKLKEAYGVLREGLKHAQSIERDRIFEDLRRPGFDGSMKIETRYDETLAKAEEVLK